MVVREYQFTNIRLIAPELSLSEHIFMFHTLKKLMKLVLVLANHSCND